MAQEPNQVSADLPGGRESNPAPAPSSAATTTEIRSQIEQTRAEMSETIDALQARLSPSRLMTDAKETVKDATVGRAKRLVGRTSGAFHYGGTGPVTAKRIIHLLEANPLPVALAGVAVTALTAWTFMRSRNGRDRLAARRHSEMPRSGHESRNAHRVRSASHGVLAGTCAGLACWTAWTAWMPSSRLSNVDRVRHQVEPEPPSV